MFCPECATRNIEPAKFCRACGTNLEIVSLALATEASSPAIQEATANSTSSESLAKARQDGLRKVVLGSVLLFISTLLAGIGFLVARDPFSWLVIWSVFFGWMACWGTVTLALGSSKLIESKMKLPQSKPTPTINSVIVGEPMIGLPPFSVTERTTRHLEEKK